MTKLFIAMLALSTMVLLGGCRSDQLTEETSEVDDVTAVIEATEGDVVTGDALMGDYVKLLCHKYSDCGIKAFADQKDCSNRLTAVLSQDANWSELRLNKEGLKSCLTDFKGLNCDDFKSGKTPESCTKL
jgi:hypothetical protein